MTTPTPARSTATKRITLLVVCVTTAMLMLDIAVVNTALPSIAVDLDAGVSSLQWVIDAYTLVLATVVPGAGSWADRRGPRSRGVCGVPAHPAADRTCVRGHRGGHGRIPGRDGMRSRGAPGENCPYTATIA
ncbi:MFS transporter [Rhodococcus rhodochrous]|jgi:hypothetical protein|uniref:MFS transporter n=1 Tax=Rhodococcus rhodochrous TaxID=1829 RepID=UPI003B8351B7